MSRETSRCREYREGWTGRRRNYKCRNCGKKFQHDGRQIPAGARYCLECLQTPEIKDKFNRAYTEARRKEYPNVS